MGIKKGMKPRIDKYYRNLIHENKRLYRIWHGMKTRCFNENAPIYKYYGKKGITVCDEWKNDFESFYIWAINNRI